GLWKGNLSAEYLYLTYGAAQFYAYYKAEDFICDLVRIQYRSACLTGIIVLFAEISTSSILLGFAEPPTAYVPRAAEWRFGRELRNGADVSVRSAADEIRGARGRKGNMYSGILQAFGSIYTEEGVRGFYRGVVPSVVQIMPYMGLMFGSFDSLKRGIGWLKVHHCLPSTSVTFEDMFCGALAGVFSKAGIFPMDVVRKRLQVQGRAHGTRGISRIVQGARAWNRQGGTGQCSHVFGLWEDEGGVGVVEK
ncbi:mitochondrial carrier domain-containing protein, partial [Endogone sp. FLAS-F59071]